MNLRSEFNRVMTIPTLTRGEEAEAFRAWRECGDRADPDNLFKATLDLLVALGLIADDNADIVTELIGRPNVPGLTGCRVTINGVEA